MTNYHHYWKIDEAFKLNSLQKKLIKEILTTAGEHGKPTEYIKVQANNAKGLFIDPIEGQEGSEFGVDYTNPTGQGLVNTARNHWDEYVMRILLVLSLSEDFHFWSDGIDWTGETFKFDCDWDGDNGAIAWAQKKGIGEAVTTSLLWISANKDDNAEPEEVNPSYYDPDAPYFCGHYEFIGHTAKGNPSAKFWSLTKVPEGYKAMWGKIGHGAQGSKVYSHAEALKKVNQKTNEGYVKE